jgi:hypothetical protein
LTTISDSTSQKFLALGQLPRKDSNNEGSVGVVFIDFAGMHDRQCTEDDKEKWHPVGPDGKKCIMGHEVRTRRHFNIWVSDLVDSNGIGVVRKTQIATWGTSSRILKSIKRTAHALKRTTSGKLTVVLSKYISYDVISDFNYVLDNNVCKPIGPEPIGPDQCQKGTHDETYKGSSGYRKIPGNTCDKSKGVSKDELVDKPCSQGEPCSLMVSWALTAM